MSSVALTTIGEIDQKKGINLGAWEFDPSYNLYVVPDFLRDQQGNQLILDFKGASEELAKRNDGRRHNPGSSIAIKEAMQRNEYRDGDLFVAPLEVLTGYNVIGQLIRPDYNVYKMLKTSAAFEKIRNVVVGHKSSETPYAVSGTAECARSSFMLHANLQNGNTSWDGEGGPYRAGVIAVSAYKENFNHG